MSEISRPSWRNKPFPHELSCEILLLVAWQGILQIRETCTTLYAVTKTRVIWARLVLHYTSEDSPTRIYLDRPISDYNSKELERLYLLWKGAEAGWRSNNRTPALIRTFDVPLPSYVNCNLITGGRWLLLTSNTGAVTYYDLEAKDITKALLISKQIPGVPSDTGMLMTIDMEADSQDNLFKFNIAFSFVCTGLEIGLNGLHEIRVWQVVLEKDTSHGMFGLRATLLATLPHHPGVSIVSAISLLGPTLAFSVTPPMMQLKYTFVVDWTKAHERCLSTSNSEVHPWRLVEVFQLSDDYVREWQEIHLLPGNRIICRYKDVIRLHNYDLKVPIPEANVTENHLFWPTSATNLTENHVSWLIPGITGTEVMNASASETTCHFSADQKKSMVIFFIGSLAYAVHLFNAPSTSYPKCGYSVEAGVPFELSHLYAVTINSEDVFPLFCIDTNESNRERIPIPSKDLLLSDQTLKHARRFTDYGSARIVFLTDISLKSTSSNTKVTVVDFSLTFSLVDT